LKILFSAEYHFPKEFFLGCWFRSHDISEAESTFMKSYNLSTASYIDSINFIGFQYLADSFFKALFSSNR
jgi:hypothetical protein